MRKPPRPLWEKPLSAELFKKNLSVQSLCSSPNFSCRIRVDTSCSLTGSSPRLYKKTSPCLEEPFLSNLISRGHREACSICLLSNPSDQICRCHLKWQSSKSLKTKPNWKKKRTWEIKADIHPCLLNGTYILYGGGVGQRSRCALLAFIQPTSLKNI